MAKGKSTGKKAVKDLKPKKGAAQKVKGGGALGRGPLATLKNKINDRVPDPY